MTKSNYNIKILSFILTLSLLIFSGCKDNQKLQESLKQIIGGNKNPSSILGQSNKINNGQQITPSEEDLVSQKNSIKACPEESILIGNAYPKGKSQWCAYKDKKGVEVKHGEFRIWHTNGNLKAIALYRDGELEGEYKEWFQNKNLKESSKYLNGRRHGKTIIRMLDGSLLEDAHYQNDQKNGPYIKYSRNSTPVEKGTFQNDLKTGLWHLYDNNGNIREKVEYQLGQKHGKVAKYNNKNTLTATGFYDKDKEIGHWIYYSPSGIKSSEGNLIYGKKHGRWVDYDKNGQSIRVSFFDNGKRTDSYKVSSSADGSINKSFGNRDILGAEPPLRRQNRNSQDLSNSTKSEKPQPLSKEKGWSPL